MYKTILVPIDVSEPRFSVAAMRHAVDKARQYGGELRVLGVLPGFGSPLVASFFPPDAEEAAQKKARTALEAFVREHAPDDLNVRLDLAVDRHPHEYIVRFAESIGADLIVMASHHREGLAGLMLGSCTRQVVEHAPCSVLVVRERHAGGVAG